MAEFFPPQPRLYTVEADGRPVVVISGISDAPPDDDMLTDPEVVAALRSSRRILAQLADLLAQRGGDIVELSDLVKIDEVLETYLGDELQTREEVQAPGRPLWDGKQENIRVRRATGEEAEIWKSSLLEAIKAGIEEPGDNMDWVAFLFPVRRLQA